MARETREFEVDGVKFKQTKLGAKASLKGFQRITKALASGAQSVTSESTLDDVVPALIAASEDLPDFADFFEKVCRFDLSCLSPAANPNSFVSLEGAMDQVFSGKPARQVAWLVKCIIWEYGDFLSESGRAPLIALGSDLSSLIGSRSKSGESTPADTTETP